MCLLDFARAGRGAQAGGQLSKFGRRNRAYLPVVGQFPICRPWGQVNFPQPDFRGVCWWEGDFATAM